MVIHPSEITQQKAQLLSQALWLHTQPFSLDTMYPSLSLAQTHSPKVGAGEARLSVGEYSPQEGCYLIHDPGRTGSEAQVILSQLHR